MEKNLMRRWALVVVTSALVGPLLVGMLAAEARPTKGKPNQTTTTTSTTSTTTTASTTTTTTTTVPTPGVCSVDPVDGASNITAAIRGCPDGSTVRFAAGKTYRAEQRVEVVDRSNLTIDGNGSRFINTYPNVEAIQPNFYVLEGTNVYLKNMTLEGNFKEAGPRSPERVARIAPNQFNAGVIFYGGDGVGITDSTVVDVFGDGVTTVSSGVIRGSGPGDPEHPKNITVRRVTIERTARQGIAITSGSHVRIEDNTIRDAWYWGIDVENDVTSVPLVDVHVNRNIFDGSFFGAIAVPALSSESSVIEIRGNKMLAPGDNAAWQCSPGILVGYWPQDPVSYWYQDVTIADNHVKTWADGISARYIDGGSITGNHIDKSLACGVTLPVNVSQSQNVTVGSNTATGF